MGYFSVFNTFPLVIKKAGDSCSKSNGYTSNFVDKTAVDHLMQVQIGPTMRTLGLFLGQPLN